MSCTHTHTHTAAVINVITQCAFRVKQVSWHPAGLQFGAESLTSSHTFLAYFHFYACVFKHIYRTFLISSVIKYQLFVSQKAFWMNEMSCWWFIASNVKSETVIGFVFWEFGYFQQLKAAAYGTIHTINLQLCFGYNLPPFCRARVQFPLKLSGVKTE